MINIHHTDISALRVCLKCTLFVLGIFSILWCTGMCNAMASINAYILQGI